MKKFEATYKSKNLSIATKVRTFNAFAASVFLYNSELWTITSTTANKIDSFHRRMLRQAINIRWPKKISKCQPLQQDGSGTMEQNDKEKTSKLAWTSDEDVNRYTNKNITIEALRPSTKKIEKTPTTWLKVIENDLKNTIHLDVYKDTADNTIAKLTCVTGDRNVWSNIIRNIMENNL